MATVELTPAAKKEAEALPSYIADRVDKLLARLERWPAVSGAKALSGNLAGSYRLRTGDYRLRFYVVGERVIVDKIGHRKDVYDD
jgi:mRNA interferase RelE/StbE